MKTRWLPAPDSGRNPGRGKRYRHRNEPSGRPEDAGAAYPGTMSDLARPYPPATAPAGFASDSRPETARQYPAGKEPASNANGHSAHAGNADKAR